MSIDEPKPSSTAIGAAIMRAQHLAFDAQPWILEDHYALAITGLPGEAALKVAQERMQADFVQHGGAGAASRIARHLRSAVVLRNRYAEEELAAAIARGVRQYVLLGAGLDSFAWRRADLVAQLEIFELDLAATQNWKRARLQAAGLAVPANLHFVPIDFERQQPMEALTASGFRSDRPAFFSWLGVTSYLTETAIFATLRNVAGTAAGSSIVFSYGLTRALQSQEGQALSDALRAIVAARGEPAASSGFVPQDLMQQLQAIGFGEITDLSVADAEARYFAGRSDDLHAAPITHHMKAVVGIDKRFNLG